MYYIGLSLISLPAGTLVDRWGVKRLLVLGQVLTTVGLAGRQHRALVHARSSCCSSPPASAAAC